MLINNDLLYYISIGLVLVHFVYLIKKLPYKSTFSNITIIFNQLVILATFFIVMCSQGLLDLASLMPIFCYVCLGLVFAVDLLATIRSIIYLK